MKGRIWYSVAMAAIGTSLLAAAMVAGPAAGGTQASAVKTGGSLTITNRSDFDYVDTGLSYFSHAWNMMAATNITLMYYPQAAALPHSEQRASPRSPTTAGCTPSRWRRASSSPTVRT